MTRNSEVLTSFVNYCQAHPDERFWQALLNWSGLPYIVAAGFYDGTGAQDTFYWEGQNEWRTKGE